MAATVDSAAASISLSRGRTLGKKRATACMKGTAGSPHGWMYLTFRWFKTSKRLESCRLINNIATGYNKNTKQMRCWATKSGSRARGRLCLHHGWAGLLKGFSLRTLERRIRGPQTSVMTDIRYTKPCIVVREPLPSTCHIPGVWYNQSQHTINHKWRF